MQPFFLSYLSEFYKSRKTLGLWSSVILPVAICGLVFLGFYTHSEKLVKYAPMMQWMHYMGATLGVMGILLLPMYTVFLTYSVNSIEHRNDTWKTLFSLPLPRWSVYGSKYVFAVTLNAICLLLFASLILASGNLMGALVPALRFGEFEITAIAFQIHLKLFLASLGMLSIQFLLSLIWTDFLKPMGIGFAGTVGGIICANSKWEHTWMIPYAQPFIALQSTASGPSKVPADALGVDIFTREIYLSLAIAAAAFVLGFFVVSRRSVK
jgi:lantibiotic transport system permease protein